MPCYRPIKGYRARVKDVVSHKRSIVFSARDGLYDQPVDLPCGQCIGCRLERSREWAVRCMHEARLYEKNCFITLTFDNEHLPVDGALDVRTFQLFMKRLRKRFGKGIRFFHCGEYGERFGRPHYHSILFNFDFPDKYIWRRSDLGHDVWRSPALEELWPDGLCEVGSCTFESAAYVARYIVKKVLGSSVESDFLREEHLGSVQPGAVGPRLKFGSFSLRKPEYATMSRRPGIGRDWFAKYMCDVFPCDQVVLRGKVFNVPKYYFRIFELICSSDWSIVKRKRKVKARLANIEPSERLAIREMVHELQFKLLSRSFEHD